MFFGSRVPVVLLLLSAICVALSSGHAWANVISEFEIIEQAGPNNTGSYTIINNSGKDGYAPEYIFAFSVTNPLASKVGDWTTDKGWFATKSDGDHDSLGRKDDLDRFDFFTNPFDPGRHGWMINPETIAPGQSVDDFFFGTSRLDSKATVFFVDADGHLGSSSAVVDAVPEPSTWVMMVLGFAALGWIAYRKGRNHGPFERLVEA